MKRVDGHDLEKTRGRKKEQNGEGRRKKKKGPNRDGDRKE